METIAEFKWVSHAYQDTDVLKDVNLTIHNKDFLVIFGPPSSGKSTLLRLLVGLQSVQQGQINLRGKDTAPLAAKDRAIGYIPQDFALYPNKTVFENIAYPLRLMKQPAGRVTVSVQETAEMLRIEDLLNKTPTQLSGGQKQRVAIARGIVKKTDIYVFDDPLAGLDFKLREKLIDDLKVLQEELQVCIIYTTSDPIETLSLASRVAVLDNRRIMESGGPDSVYLAPRQLSTMKVLGFPQANLLNGTLDGSGSNTLCQTPLFDFRVSLETPAASPEGPLKVCVGFRPENIVEQNGREDGLGISADIYLREDLGAEEIIYLNEEKEKLIMLRPSNTGTRYDVNDRIRISIDPGTLFVFDQETGNRIGRGIGNAHV